MLGLEIVVILGVVLLLAHTAARRFRIAPPMSATVPEFFPAWQAFRRGKIRAISHSHGQAAIEIGGAVRFSFVCAFETPALLRGGL
ncbi:hypothetical protein [Streptomyces mirabilis]|uniref:hypothetical protein n=1 Tax=Streptomyces mirabilis TaxID=68239 RepID=UPI0033B1C9D5